MACPMGYGVRFEGGYHIDENEDDAQSGVNKAAFSDHHVSYAQYLGLDMLLSCQQLRSGRGDQLVPDEHLFIIIHQAYELWFKQIIYDIDHVRKLLDNKIVDETKTLKIVSLLERTVRILKLLVDQMLVLETMSPLDFVEFRKYLASASGFQSLQFRLLENKLGVEGAYRVRYNAQHYREVFTSDKDRDRIISSEEEPSLFVLIERWLARTPGIYEENIVIDNGNSSAFESEFQHNVTLSRCDSVADTLVNNASAKSSCWNASLYDGSTTRTAIETDNNEYVHKRLCDENVWQKKSTTGMAYNGLTGTSFINDGDGNNYNNNGAAKSLVNANVNDCESSKKALGMERLKERTVSDATDDETSQTAIKRKNFWNHYLDAVDKYLLDMKMMAKDEKLSSQERKNIQEEYVKTKRSFETITDEKQHQALLAKGERRLSHNALKGALMIYFYRDMPRFSQPYQILTFLMDIDSLLQKWRYNHVMLVQRMLGSKAGTGGSSGYLYLRSTVSDRYKVFLDLFNLSTWLIPRIYIPKLSPKMVKTLSEHSNLNS